MKMLKVLHRVFNEILGKMPGRKVFFIYTHQNYFDRFRYGMKANTEISYWSQRALQEQFPRVNFLKLEKERPEKIAAIRPKDVVIGHIGETYLRAAQRTQRIIAFYPWSGHEDRSESTLFNCLPKKDEKQYLDLAASIIWLTSEYNVREYVHQNRNFWYEWIRELQRKKSVHFVHQPLDLHFFKRVKFDYQSSNFLYIGNNAHMKGLPEGLEITKRVGREFHVFGVGDRRFDHLDQKSVGDLARAADFFLQPGLWEAQCVSILEAAARGFIPIVTPETGYPYHHPFLLKSGDRSHNLAVVKELLKTTSEERKALADTLHNQLINDQNHNTWHALAKVLVEEVRKLYS